MSFTNKKSFWAQESRRRYKIQHEQRLVRNNVKIRQISKMIYICLIFLSASTAQFQHIYSWQHPHAWILPIFGSMTCTKLCTKALVSYYDQGMCKHSLKICTVSLVFCHVPPPHALVSLKIPYHAYNEYKQRGGWGRERFMCVCICVCVYMKAVCSKQEQKPNYFQITHHFGRKRGIRVHWWPAERRISSNSICLCFPASVGEHDADNENCWQIFPSHDITWDCSYFCLGFIRHGWAVEEGREEIKWSVFTRIIQV